MGGGWLALEIRDFSLVTCQADYFSRVRLLIRCRIFQRKILEFPSAFVTNDRFITIILCRKASQSFLSYFAIPFQQARRKPRNFPPQCLNEKPINCLHPVATTSSPPATALAMRPVAQPYSMSAENVPPKSAWARVMPSDAACADTECFTRRERRGIQSIFPWCEAMTDAAAEWCNSRPDEQ